MATKTRGQKKGLSPNLLALIGEPKELLESELLTLRQCLQYAKLVLDRSVVSRAFSARDALREVASKVRKIWLSANPKLPLTADKTTLDRLVREWERAKKFSHPQANQKDKDSLEESLEHIFDICKCSCVIYECQDFSCGGCVAKAHVHCKCVKTNKIPKEELRFMFLQRKKVGEKSDVQIGPSVDTVKVASQKKTTKRKVAFEKQKAKAKKAAMSESTVSSASIDATPSDNLMPRGLLTILPFAPFAPLAPFVLELY